MNDPLDSSINIEKEYEKAVQQIHKTDKYPNIQKSFLIYLLNKSDSFVNASTGKRISLNEAIQDFISIKGICSFSKTPQEPLLWSHYADGHRGICLGFDTDLLLEKPIFIGSEVEYLSKPPYVDIFLDLVDQLGKIVRPWDNHHHSNEEADQFYSLQLATLIQANLFVKSEKWQYEEEYRLISSLVGANKFKSNALKEIIFGIKSSTATIEAVKNILKEADFSHVKIKRVQHVEGTFEFRVEEFI